MSVRPRAPWPVLAAFVMGLAPPALAEPALFGTAEVGLGGGYDTNMFLQISPDAAMREPRLSGWFGQAAPKLGAAVAAGGWRLDLDYGVDYRGSEAAGHLAMQELEMSISLHHLGRLRPTVSGHLGRFDASRFGESRFVFAGAGLDLRLELADSFRLNAAYQGEVRDFSARPDEADTLHVAALRTSYRPTARFELGLGGSYVKLQSSGEPGPGNVDLGLARLGPDVQAQWGAVSLGAALWAGTIAASGVSREALLGGSLSVLCRLGENVDAAAGLEVTVAPWASALAAGSYTRQRFFVSMIAHTSGRTALRRQPRPPGLHPAVREGQVVFRMRAPAGSSVTVIGSWDEWASPGVAMSATREADLWEARLDLAPGTHRYRFLVDGRAVRPPDASRYVKDDFDGEDAVIDVPSKTGTP